MLGRLVGQEIEKPDRTPESFWGDALPVLRTADLVIGGLECAVTTHPHPWNRYPKMFHFKAPPRAAEVLKAGNIGLVALANNHVLDFEEQGLLDTLEHLDDAGIAHAGAGRNREEARRPVVVDVRGFKVGMLSLTDNEPAWEAGIQRPGTHYLDIEPTPPAFRRVAEGVEQARSMGAQFVVLSVHWGPNMRLRPPTPFREFARGCLARGVDLIHGHSAHIFQGVEVHQGKPILYDTGDFLDDYAVDPVLRNDQSLIFLADVGPEGVERLRLLPVRLHLGRVDLATGPDLEEISTRMQALSSELDTVVQRRGRWLEVRLERQKQLARAA